jgi:uncharacterized protein UPF0547
MTGDERRLAAELARARDSLEAGKLGRAVREAWHGGQIAARLNDERSLEAVIELAEAIRDRSSGREQEDVAVLARYCSHCLTHARAGVRPSVSPLARLVGLGSSQPVKTCPQCAETIKAAAKVCRFCGHRFD